jgi:hypothetical protein
MSDAAKSGHGGAFTRCPLYPSKQTSAEPLGCPLSAKSRHRASLFDHPVAPLRSWRHEESQVESSEHQDNANIHYQPLPEAVSEEDKIYTHYNSCHRQHVKHYNHPSVHFSTTSLFHFLRSGPRPTQLRDAAAPPDEPTGKPVN